MYPLKKAVISVEPGESGAFQIESPGTYLRTKEADYPFDISFDDGDWLPFDVGMTANTTNAARFQRFKVRHFGPTSAEFVFLIGDGVTVDDGRLTISESRNGSASSMIPPNLDEIVSKVGVDGVVVDIWYLLADYDAGRAEIWLTTDAAALAYWGLSDNAAERAANNIKPTTAEDRWLKLKTKAAIWVKHKEAGKSITALTFSF